MVWRTHRLAGDLGVENGQYLALPVGLDEIGAEFVTEPNMLTDELHRLDVEVGARQVALLRAFVDDQEGHLLVRVVQEHGLQALHAATLPVRLDVVEHQHGVG
ncbi:hypothetical protein SDC9_141210 [bioreactor metagenome]|uniref:Uncharacterized protein n=1 Tax=bioreactor metagenome TaxID=1076179 RepID=A0A645DXG0_9ZZZZ